MTGQEFKYVNHAVLHNIIFIMFPNKSLSMEKTGFCLFETDTGNAEFVLAAHKQGIEIQAIKTMSVSV